MRLRLVFTGDKTEITLPVHHNEVLQGIIYRHLDFELARRVHSTGIKDPESNRGLKFFTFSRLIPSKKPKIDTQKKTITFYFPLTWIVASPIQEFIASFCNNLIKKRILYLQLPGSTEERAIYLAELKLEPFPAYKRPEIVETLSPITVYRTEEKDGKAYTHYFSPHDPEFNELILFNLLRKYRAITGKKLFLDEKSYIKPLRIGPHENIVFYKDTIIKGWSGIFELALPQELFSLAFACGLGSKNSQGFGCIAKWRGDP
jgi:CRISPR-associated endoribonuclease Cas6